MDGGTERWISMLMVGLIDYSFVTTTFRGSSLCLEIKQLGLMSPIMLNDRHQEESWNGLTKTYDDKIPFTVSGTALIVSMNNDDDDDSNSL